MLARRIVNCDFFWLSLCNIDFLVNVKKIKMNVRKTLCCLRMLGLVCLLKSWVNQIVCVVLSEQGRVIRWLKLLFLVYTGYVCILYWVVRVGLAIDLVEYCNFNGIGLCVHVLDKKQKILFFSIIEFFYCIIKMHLHFDFLYFMHGRFYIFILICLCSSIYARIIFVSIIRIYFTVFYARPVPHFFMNWMIPAPYLCPAFVTS
jgi:hypothetical protein